MKTVKSDTEIHSRTVFKTTAPVIKDTPAEFCVLTSRPPRRDYLDHGLIRAKSAPDIFYIRHSDLSRCLDSKPGSPKITYHHHSRRPTSTMEEIPQVWQHYISEPETPPAEKQDICSADISSIVDCFVVATVVCLYRSLFDLSTIYHFIRGQSLLKLYVVFNMLEIAERMWRSLERDALDDLRLHVDQLVVLSSSTQELDRENKRKRAIVLMFRYFVSPEE